MKRPPYDPNNPAYDSSDVYDRTVPQPLPSKLNEAMFDASVSANNWLDNFRTGVAQSQLPTVIKNAVGPPNTVSPWEFAAQKYTQVLTDFVKKAGL